MSQVPENHLEGIILIQLDVTRNVPTLTCTVLDPSLEAEPCICRRKIERTLTKDYDTRDIFTPPKINDVAFLVVPN